MRQGRHVGDLSPERGPPAQRIPHICLHRGPGLVEGPGRSGAPVGAEQLGQGRDRGLRVHPGQDSETGPESQPVPGTHPSRHRPLSHGRHRWHRRSPGDPAGFPPLAVRHHRVQAPVPELAQHVQPAGLEQDGEHLVDQGERPDPMRPRGPGDPPDAGEGPIQNVGPAAASPVCHACGPEDTPRPRLRNTDTSEAPGAPRATPAGRPAVAGPGAGPRRRPG